MGKKISLSHGSGGADTYNLLKDLFNPYSNLISNWAKLGVIGIEKMDDSGFIELQDGTYMAFTIDAYTVSPMFFPGGDIGVLAASGTLNDLIVSGAEPVAVVDSIIVEEGTDDEVLKRVFESFMKELEVAKVPLIGGDFKVMPRGSISGIVIITAGVGKTDYPITDDRIRPGDKIIVTGPIGTHGAVIAAEQYGLKISGSSIRSDVRPLLELLPVLKKFKSHIHAARDPTRGGIAMVLNEWAEQNGIAIFIDEGKLPVYPWVKAISDILGIDFLSLANEGMAVIAVDKGVSREFLSELRASGFSSASEVGEVAEGGPEVVLKTEIGGSRLVEPPTGIIVPRIC